MKITIQPIEPRQAYPILLQNHYARRLCPISHCFGGYDGARLIGVVTYGVPVSSGLRVGVCGAQWQTHVLELNRLCCENEPDVASQMVGQSLRQLPKPKIVVSYADTSQGHIGYVYQATNFIYTGLSAKRTDWTLAGVELHSATVVDMSRGRENRAQWMRESFGDAFSLHPRPRKHRYIYFCADKRQRRQLRAALIYPVVPYPKGESQRYECGALIAEQPLLFCD